MTQYLEPNSSIDQLWGKDMVTHTVTTTVKTAKRKVTRSRGRRDYFSWGHVVKRGISKWGKFQLAETLKD